jgi:hypothetical protein
VLGPVEQPHDREWLRTRTHPGGKVSPRDARHTIAVAAVAADDFGRGTVAGSGNHDPAAEIAVPAHHVHG